MCCSTDTSEATLPGIADDTACVTNVQRFSLHDGGGIRTVVFMKGCPFHCPWCCNPENLSPTPEVSFKPSLCIRCSPLGADGMCVTPPEDCPTGAKETLGLMRTVPDLLADVMRDAPFFEESSGGVTISGGECLSEEDFVIELLSACKDRGVSTAVETTLALPLGDPCGLVSCCDELLVDFKVADRERSLDVCGIDPLVRDDNLQRVLDLGARVVARLPIIPGFTDGPGDVGANIADLVRLGIERADVLPFHQLGEGKYAAVGRDYACADMPQLTEDDVAGVAGACRRAGLEVVVSGE